VTLLALISPQSAATPAAIVCVLLFVWYHKRAKDEMTLFKSDIFYAGLLTSSMIWIMFYFA
jgi:SSS family solute:Na+ symporter